jgi:hypothetical protein
MSTSTMSSVATATSRFQKLSLGRRTCQRLNGWRQQHGLPRRRGDPLRCRGPAATSDSTLPSLDPPQLNAAGRASRLIGGPAWRRCRPSLWFLLAASLGLLMPIALFPRLGDDLLVALLFDAFIVGGVTLSYWLAGKRENRNAAALCTLLGAAWGFAAGYAQYWSTCDWFVWVDVLLIWLVCLVAQARICRLSVGGRLAAYASLLLAITWVCYAMGDLVRGFCDDPRM